MLAAMQYGDRLNVQAMGGGTVGRAAESSAGEPAAMAAAATMEMGESVESVVVSLDKAGREAAENTIEHVEDRNGKPEQKERQSVDVLITAETSKGQGAVAMKVVREYVRGMGWVFYAYIVVGLTAYACMVNSILF